MPLNEIVVEQKHRKRSKKSYFWAIYTNLLTENYFSERKRLEEMQNFVRNHVSLATASKNDFQQCQTKLKRSTHLLLTIIWIKTFLGISWIIITPAPTFFIKWSWKLTTFVTSHSNSYERLLFDAITNIQARE